MNIILWFVTLTSVVIVHGQSADKGIIPYPRVGRPDRFYMDGKRDGNTLSPGLIPFPRIGRSDGGIHEGKRQLIPFPRVGKRPFWHLPTDQYAVVDYDEFTYPSSSSANSDPSVLRSGFRGIVALNDPSSGSQNNIDENDTEKRSSNNNNGGGIWFGPRLGRRKRSITIEADVSVEQDSLDTGTLAKILGNFNWALIPVKEKPSRLGHEDIESHRRKSTLVLKKSNEIGSDEIRNEIVDQHTKSATSTGEIKNSGSVPASTSLSGDQVTPKLVHSDED